MQQSDWPLSLLYAVRPFSAAEPNPGPRLGQSQSEPKFGRLRWRFLMLDIAYVIGGCAFFAVAMLYATACGKL
jgi:hypothetical protein